MILRVILAAMFLAASTISGAVAACGPTCPTADQPSTLTSTHYTGTSGINAVAQSEWDGGIHAQADLLAATAIGVAESSLWDQARNWHPEYGCRPASDYIGVQGPDTVWNSDHTQQLNSDRGIWQISSHFFPQYTDHVTDNLIYGAAATLEIEQGGDGTGWNQWDTYKSGAAQSHYDASVDGWPALRPIINTFCSSHACT